MVWVPAGDFLHGSGSIYTTEAFFIDIYETRAGAYKGSVEAGECNYSESTTSSYRSYENNKDNHPMNFVNWQEAVDYCAWKGKRLPNEDEWVKAAFGTDERTYPWGEELPTCEYVVMKDEDGADGCGTWSTWEVWSKVKGVSPYGGHDMAGNVFEWTDTWWNSDQTHRLLRGGSFGSDGGWFKRWPRFEFLPAERCEWIGFRCVQSQ